MNKAFYEVVINNHRKIEGNGYSRRRFIEKVDVLDQTSMTELESCPVLKMQELLKWYRQTQFKIRKTIGLLGER